MGFPYTGLKPLLLESISKLHGFCKRFALPKKTSIYQSLPCHFYDTQQPVKNHDLFVEKQAAAVTVRQIILK
ncbi:hypothetical protein [Nitrosomonas marina]|uniref:hypothetical protein n=1 Tax=Nitrosomonas marina TaxID=917 RepID=UPI000B89ADD4|nr:hypothetical protein [Nitrosomonas marina]